MKKMRLMIEVMADKSVSTAQLRNLIKERLPRDVEATASMRQDGASGRDGSVYWATLAVKQVSK